MALGNSHIVWTPGTTLEQIERQAIELAHAFFRNKASAARSLGISVKTLETKIKKYEAEDADEKRLEHDRSEDRKRLLAAQRGDVYEPIPYVEPEAEASEGDDYEDAPKTFAQQKLKDAPPVIPPPAGNLTAKVVGAR